MKIGSKSDRSGGIIAWFAGNHVAANILMGFLLIGGAISLWSMRSETFPAIDPNIITVSVVYPGATPYEVEDSISSRLEEVVKGIEGIKRISAEAREGYGFVKIEVKDFGDPEQVYDDVETAVNGLVAFPPEDAERPSIKRIRVTPDVMTLAVYGDVPELTLYEWCRKIEEDLQLLSGVSLTSLRGLREKEISIEVSEEKLRDNNISLGFVADAIRTFSSDTPAGNMETSQGEILLRVQEKRYTGEEFGNIPLRTGEDGSSLYVSDVANVVDGFNDASLASRFNGERAGFIDIKRSESQDTLEVAASIRGYLETLSLPEGIELTILEDETVRLNERLNLMIRNSIIGFALVFLILTLFLDLKLAVWTSAAIPISFLGGIILLNQMGYSLNMISLFALIVVLGIVVDDGVVTGESIFEEQEKAPGDRNAALKGVKAVIAPVTVGVVTTMAAFAPLFFSTGALGQIISIIPVVVIPILFVSLIEAYVILPAHLSKPTRWSIGPVAALRDRMSKMLFAFTDGVLLPFARFCIRWRYATLGLFVAVGIFTYSMVVSGQIRFVFFPSIEGDSIRINVKTPVGSPFDSTEALVAKVEDAIWTVDRETADGGAGKVVKSVSANVGISSGGASGTPFSVGSGNRGSHFGEITVQLTSSSDRDLSAADIESLIRAKTERLPGIEELTFQSSLTGNESDIEVELSHADEEELARAAESLKEELSRLPGAINVSTSFEQGKVEYLFELNEQGLAVGLTPQELGSQLRAAYFGQEVQRIQKGNDEVIVYVRYPKSEREELEALDNARVRLRDGSEVALSTVTDRIEQRGYSVIESVDGLRVVSVLSDADLSISTPNEIIAALESSVFPDLIKKFPGLRCSFEGETRDQAEDLDSLWRNMQIALLLIYCILGAQLRSYSQPVLIMVAAIPFGVVGAIWGHVMFGYDLTFISLFGV
ncbi:MAG: efflux RND transporter permease subunit, partial [Verrucomicrobiota bacterium]